MASTGCTKLLRSLLKVIFNVILRIIFGNFPVEMCRLFRHISFIDKIQILHHVINLIVSSNYGTKFSPEFSCTGFRPARADVHTQPREKVFAPVKLPMWLALHGPLLPFLTCLRPAD